MLNLDKEKGKEKGKTFEIFFFRDDNKSENLINFRQKRLPLFTFPGLNLFLSFYRLMWFFISSSGEDGGEFAR